MQTFLIVTAIVLGLAGLLAFLYFYFNYRSSPKSIWAARIRTRVAEWNARLAVLDRKQEIPREETQLRDEFFRRHLQSIPYSAVQGYPGIGVGMSEKLAQENFRNLAELIGYDFMRIPGFGPVKSREMTHAVDELHREARQRFDAGACAEAAEFHRRIAAAVVARAVQAEAMKREAAGIHRALASGRELIEMAKHVTFMNSVMNSGNVPGLDDIQLGRSLPEVTIDAKPEPLRVTPVPPPVALDLPKVAKPSRPGSTAFPPTGTVPQSPAGPQPDLFQRELGRGTSAASTAPANPGVAKLRAFCGFLLMIAKADGRIAKAERNGVRATLGDHFGSDPVLLRFIDPTLEAMEKAIPGEAEALAAVLPHATAAERKSLLAAAHRIADATSERNEREDDCINRVAAAFGIEEKPRASPSVVAPVPVTMAADPRAVLEIEPGTPLSVELIRRRYTLLTEKTDLVRASAMGPEFAKLAADKRQAVRAAAETLMAPFGEPLDKPTPAASTDLRDNPMLDDVFGA